LKNDLICFNISRRSTGTVSWSPSACRGNGF